MESQKFIYGHCSLNLFYICSICSVFAVPFQFLVFLTVMAAHNRPFVGNTAPNQSLCGFVFGQISSTFILDPPL